MTRSRVEPIEAEDHSRRQLPMTEPGGVTAPTSEAARGRSPLNHLQIGSPPPPPGRRGAAAVYERGRDA